MRPFDRPKTERTILGACLIDPSIIPEVAAAISPEDFGLTKNREMFEAIVKIPPADLNVVTASRSAGWELLEASALLDDVVSAVFWKSAAVDLVDARRRNRILGVAANAAAKAKNPTNDSREIATQAADELLAEAGRVMDAKSRCGGELVYPVLEDLDHRSSPDYDQGPTFGLTDLDAMIGGLSPSDLILVAASPSVGKTALAIQLAVHAAGERRRVAIVSLEMGHHPITTRMLSLIAKTSLYRTLHGRLSPREWDRVVDAGSILSALPISVMDSAVSTVADIRAECSKLKPDLVIVDYLQLITPGKADTRNEEVSQISRGLKRLAMEIRKPLVALSQLKRLETPRIPRLSDLRDSGSLEQDADLVVMLHREDDKPKERWAIVAKHRNGPTGNIRLHWDGEQTRFSDATTRQDG